MQNAKVLAVIPARGGSKSVPQKNIKELSGKPLIVHTIETAQNVRSIDMLVVSTDSIEISNIVQKYGVMVIDRPPMLSTDEAPTEWALLHALDELDKNEGITFDFVLTLEPTSPLRSAQTINKCIEVLKKGDVDSALGVVETTSNYGRIQNGLYEYLIPGQPRRRQEREPLYKESSTIYGTDCRVLKQEKSVIAGRLAPVIVPPWEAIDINTPFDFELAEILIKKYRGTSESEVSP